MKRPLPAPLAVHNVLPKTKTVKKPKVKVANLDSEPLWKAKKKLNKNEQFAIDFFTTKKRLEHEDAYDETVARQMNMRSTQVTPRMGVRTVGVASQTEPLPPRIGIRNPENDPLDMFSRPNGTRREPNETGGSIVSRNPLSNQVLTQTDAQVNNMVDTMVSPTHSASSPMRVYISTVEPTVTLSDPWDAQRRRQNQESEASLRNLGNVDPLHIRNG